MTDLVLRCEIDLCHGLSERGEIEQRIISEASAATRLREDFSLDGTFGGVDTDAVAREGEHTAVLGMTLADRNCGESSEQVCVVPLICSHVIYSYVTWGHAWVAVEGGVSGVAGGADSGFSVERVDFETGVVGDDKPSGSESAIVNGLEARVAGEGGLVFGWSGDFGQSGQWGNGELVVFGGGLEVAQLAGVAGGGVERLMEGIRIGRMAHRY